MDINKLTNHINGHINGSGGAENSQKASEASTPKQEDSFSDKVSLNKFNNRKSEELFAKIELEKLNQSSFSRLKDLKSKLVEYENAKNDSAEAAQETEIGKMINDPDVWESIAKNIVGE